MTAPADSDILSAVGMHPAYGIMFYERAKQDKRTYYRLTGERFTCGITTAKAARENIAHWKTKGWMKP